MVQNYFCANSLLEKGEEETNEQSVLMGVRAEKVKGLFVYSFSEKDPAISNNCLVALSKGKEKYFFVCNTEIDVEHSCSPVTESQRSNGKLEE